MNSPNDAHADPNEHTDVDPIDEEAAEIDARSEDAPEKIQQLIHDAETMGRPATQAVDTSGASRGASGADGGIDTETDDEPEVLPG
ncbi:MAG TPA: hypothetical protein VGC84_00795 [Ilumatobacteraceae bacterium]